ncbi:MAG TPA: UbiD family decarboxylase [Thermodesulfobacteriota bacterium]|nr:UbiD family decarboxylase [Thermodesulfobacteriota bacterium]
MPKDLAGFVGRLAERRDELLRIERLANAQAYEVTALLEHLYRRGLTQAVLFERVTNLLGEESGFPLVTNVFGTRQRVALALDWPEERAGLDLSVECARRTGRTLPAERLARGLAPVQEVVHSGPEADLRRLPIVRHYEKDLSEVGTMALVLRDPDGGFYDISFCKLFPKGARRAGISIHTPHLERIAGRYAELDRPCPAAFVLGHHPAFYLGSLALTPFGTNDYDAVGAFLGEPLRLAPSVSLGDDFLVPADAEIVVEGIIPPGVPEVVDPFGEVTGYYQAQCIRQRFEVTAITHRRRAIYQDVFSGHPEHWNLGGIAREGSLYQALQRRFGNVTGVHLPYSGCARLIAYVSIRKRREGEAKLVGLAALNETWMLNVVVVVDEEIDVFDEREVLWAVVSQTDPARDVDLIRNAYNLFHTAGGYQKVVIDATRPLDRAFPERFRVPPEAMARVKLEEWLPHGADLLGRLPGVRGALVR